MRFQVPQFIEVEDKIFGPFTLKQFIYLAGAGGITVAAFSFLPKFLAILVSLPFVLLALALTFYKINNKPFSYILEAFFKYTSSSKLYIWKKAEKKPVGKSGEVGSNTGVFVPKMSNSKLKDLSWSLDVQEANTPNTKSESGSNPEK